ncbi:MAG: undecaprenyldiphospho-muramoylpentapeptide beta-N-acetylglucosaminyltransferase [Proteobacteria bacterium]|nr:undecaprenyldiphospho-muramoylpentapeptide beta-N-acetylglucosaminyltransferase [Pseudomonadota bacterium]
MSEIKKVLFAAGGTGGHVFPAIAVADAMKAVYPEVEIAFVGAAHGNESNWVQKAGYRFILCDIDFIKGASLGRKLKNLCSLPGVARKASKILADEKPDLVIGSGGYVSGPLVAMAAWKKIRTAIMEQNAIPGLTNRILSRHVDKIYISFEHTDRLPAKKLVYFGNPVRAAVLPKSDAQNSESWETSCSDKPLAENGIHLLVFGGSQGAMKLNTDVPKALAQLSEAERDRICVWHQAGKNKLEETENAYKTEGLTVKTTEFIDNMGVAYRWANLLICRAGATSLAEIKASGKASILVPFPYAAHNHQEKNADAVVAIGAAIKVLNDNVATEIPNIIKDLMDNPEKIVQMEQASLSDAKPNAAVDIAKDCLGLN